MIDFTTKLRIETSINCSGELLNESRIFELKEKHYYVKDYKLDGDAPKQFIHAYLFSPDSGFRKKDPITWPSYIAKTAEKWYPHESVIEFMINRIGQELGLLMNEIELVKANGQIRFMSKYFLNKNEKLIHGAEICGQHLGDMEMADKIAKDRNTARELFTYEFIKEAIQCVFPNCYSSILIGLVKMIAFDAIVGNNDRHFYNWGVIDTKKKTKKTPTFAPLYDSARGLLWNLEDDNIIKYAKNHHDGGKKVINYIDDAYPRISIEQNSDANHFDLIRIVKQDEQEYVNMINELSSVENEEKVIKMLKKDFFKYFIPERSNLVELILRDRFDKVRSI